MPVEPFPYPRFIAEPPQEHLPSGRWAFVLEGHFRAAAESIEGDEEVGECGEIRWFPDRSYRGRTYVPGSVLTSEGFEVFGLVSFARETAEDEAADFQVTVDYTDETAERNPDWKLDLRDHELGTWHGDRGRRGQISIVFGDSLISHGAIATAELGPVTTDQCELQDDRFTLVSLDDYCGDLLEVRIYAAAGRELAVESLYDED